MGRHAVRFSGDPDPDARPVVDPSASLPNAREDWSSYIQRAANTAAECVFREVLKMNALSKLMDKMLPAAEARQLQGYLDSLNKTVVQNYQIQAMQDVTRLRVAGDVTDDDMKKMLQEIDEASNVTRAPKKVKVLKEPVT
jgi:hypothetical protein